MYNSYFVYISQKVGATALMLAAVNNKVEVVRALVTRKDINLRLKNAVSAARYIYFLIVNKLSY